MVNDPSGAVDLHWWFKNVPVALARPFFMGGDPRLDVSVANSTDMVRCKCRHARVTRAFASLLWSAAPTTTLTRT
jgi:hypothetical protein